MTAKFFNKYVIYIHGWNSHVARIFLYIKNFVFSKPVTYSSFTGIVFYIVL